MDGGKDMRIQLFRISLGFASLALVCSCGTPKPQGAALSELPGHPDAVTSLADKVGRAAKADWKTRILNGSIKAFCVDFNWAAEAGAGFAKPGAWADADPAKHVDWYEELGCNVIQTFAVSANGYAWYKGGKIPPQPGLVHDFLPEVVKQGHAKGMLVTGYFCIDSNPRWGQENPDLCYPGQTHNIPFTDAYLDYLESAITESLTLTGMDGFMIDWFWNPKNNRRPQGQWLPAEKELFEQLTGRPFPGEDKLTAEAKLDYERKAIDRCWERIRSAAKRINPDCVIWLSCNTPSDPSIANSKLLKEIDWMMDEKGRPEALSGIAKMYGQHTKQLLCLVGWGNKNKTVETLSVQGPMPTATMDITAGPMNLHCPCLSRPTSVSRLIPSKAMTVVLRPWPAIITGSRSISSQNRVHPIAGRTNDEFRAYTFHRLIGGPLCGSRTKTECHCGADG